MLWQIRGLTFILTPLDFLVSEHHGTIHQVQPLKHNPELRIWRCRIGIEIRFTTCILCIYIGCNGWKFWGAQKWHVNEGFLSAPTRRFQKWDYQQDWWSVSFHQTKWPTKTKANKMNMSSEHKQKKNIIISQNQTSYLLIIVGWQGAPQKQTPLELNLLSIQKEPTKRNYLSIFNPSSKKQGRNDREKTSEKVGCLFLSKPAPRGVELGIFGKHLPRHDG